MNCQICGTVLPVDAMYCPQCGTKVAAPTGAQFIVPTMKFQLPPAIAANIDQFTGRTWLLPTILHWYEQTNERLFILTGEPGTGKSMIMAWLAGAVPRPTKTEAQTQLEYLRTQVKAIHFCVAASGTTDPKDMARQMAEQLRRNMPGFDKALTATLGDQAQIVLEQQIGHVATGGSVTGIGSLNLGNLSEELSFNRILRDPLKQLYADGYDQPMLLLIDALDEAMTYSGTTNIVHLLTKLTDLPHQVRFLVTTRPHPPVLDLLHEYKPFDLIKDAPPNVDDVREYIYEQLVGVAEEQRTLLAQHISRFSEGIFLYAYLLLQDKNLLSRLSATADLATIPLPKGLSGLYLNFLDRQLGKDRTQWHHMFKSVLGLIAVAQGVGLSRTQIEDITGQEIEETLEICKQYLDGELSQGPFRPFHKSFADFLLDDKENTIYHIDSATMHRQIADYYLVEYSDKWSKCQEDYALCYVPTHLFQAIRCTTKPHDKETAADKLYAILFDFCWLQAKLKWTDIFSVIADYEYLTDHENVRSLCGVLRLSAFILQHDKAQLKSQLYGRLMNSGNHAIQAFLEQIKQTNSTQWLRPIRNSLTSPDGPLLYTLEGHTDAIFDIAITPDSRYAVSASRDETLRVWDIENGTELRTIFGHGRPVRSVAITPDGRYAISASEDATIRIWDIQRGVQCGEPLNGGTVPIFSVAVSADGKTIISGSKDGVLTLWDFGSRKMRTSMKAHKGTISALKVSPNGEDVFSAACDGTLRIWNWKSLSRVDEPCPRPHVTKPMKSAIATTTPDGNKIISLVDERTLQVWSQRSDDNIIMLKGHTDLINSVCVTPDSLFAISASDDTTVRVWRLADGQKIKVLRDHPRGVDAVAISTNGKHLLSGGWDRNLKVWDVKKVIETPETANEQDHLNSVNALVITPDAKHAISASRDNNLKIWRLVDANVIHTLRGHQDVVWATAVTPDSRYVVSASWDCTLKKWDISDGKEIYTLNGHTRPVSAVAISPDGNRIVSASLDRTLKIWDLDSGTLLHTLSGHRDCVWSITITQDGRYVASGSWDRTVHIWDLQTGTHIRTLEKHPHGVTSVVSTPDNEYLISIAGYSQRILDVAKLYLPKRGKDARLSKLKYFREMKAAQKGTMNVWSMKNGELLATIALQGAVIGAITITPDSRTIIYAVDHQVRVSDIATLSNGVSDADLLGHEREISRLVAMQRRNGFLSASLDGSCRVWNLDTREIVAAFSGESPVLSCAVSPDDNVLVLGEESGRVHILRLTDGG